MWIDPIVEELHKVRQAYAAKFDYDLRAMVRDCQQRQKHGNKKIVSFARKAGTSNASQHEEPATAVS